MILYVHAHKFIIVYEYNAKLYFLFIMIIQNTTLNDHSLNHVFIFSDHLYI
jgi:hypothetical protein